MEEATSLCGSSKRGNKGTGNISQIVNCLVDGCNADLNLCREYHRRHKVCELHSKSPRVTICGREQRFCQQCSRFHSLSEFDDEKRSCRKRLDGHNKRRRKPQPESLTRNSGLIFSSQQGTRLVSFGSPVTFNGGSTWPTVINNNQTDLNHIIRRNSINEPSTQFQLIDSDRNRDHDQALSLLSSAPPPPPPPPPPSVTIGFNNHHMVQSQNLQFNNNLAQYPFESKPIIDNSNVHFHEMFQNGPDGSSTSGSQQTLTFMWK